jgi:lipoprotein-anchoring transpeptidase ErfK/SrfK
MTPANMKFPMVRFGARFSNISPLKLTCALVLPFALMLSSCATKPKPAPTTQKQAFQMYEWNSELAAKTKGSSSVVIYLDRQKAYFFKGDDQIGWTYVATGLPAHPTPSGNFRIMEKTVDKISNLYGRLVDSDGNTVQGDFNLAKETLPEGCQFKPARMPLYMRLKGDGTGMHVGPIPRPGKPASHGCIRMPRAMAERFFANVGIGTPVTIHQSGPAEEAAGNGSKSKRKSRFARS